MPRTLNRAGRYGWSYAYGRDQRTPSKKYLENFEQIQFDEHKPEEWEEKKVFHGERSGRAIVKRF